MSGKPEITPGPNEAYSLAARAGDLYFLAGHVGRLEGGLGADAPFDVQVRRSFERLFATLAQLGLDKSALVKVNAFLADIDDFETFNAIYKELVPEPRPPRTTTEARIAHDWKFEVDAVALAR